jgi:hypothetical protein
MAQPNETDKPLSASDLQGPAQDFLTFCAEERDRRLNCGETFDRQLFDEAVDLVRRRLEVLAGEDV